MTAFMQKLTSLLTLSLAILPLLMTAELVANESSNVKNMRNNSLQVVRISNLNLVSTQSARKELSYLASCSLPSSKMLVASYMGKRYEFPGDMGFAPNWDRQPLSQIEERWVTACLLARTNKFGQKVKISMRTNRLSEHYIETTPSEIEQYDAFEGAFFGNLFSNPASAYVCLPKKHQNNAENFKTQKRVCTLANANAPLASKDGVTVSQCGFVIVGECAPTFSQEVKGEQWDEVIQVWLNSAH